MTSACVLCAFYNICSTMFLIKDVNIYCYHYPNKSLFPTWIILIILNKFFDITIRNFLGLNILDRPTMEIKPLNVYLQWKFCEFNVCGFSWPTKNCQLTEKILHTKNLSIKIHFPNYGAKCMCTKHKLQIFAQPWFILQHWTFIAMAIKILNSFPS